MPRLAGRRECRAGEGFLYGRELRFPPHANLCTAPVRQVLTQMLLYYTRFLDLVKETYPGGAPFAQYILSIPTLMNEIKNFSRTF